MHLYIDGIGILGPGLDGWLSSRRIFSGKDNFKTEEALLPVPNILSSNERRRSSETVKLALHVALEAINHSHVKPQELSTVFASSDGDGMILHKLCSALTSSAPQISPTLFHHSVHNAAAGYWAIAHHSQLPSTSISCHDGTFSGGLLEATLQIAVEGIPTLMVAYDVPAPSPLHEARPIFRPFGIALSLRPEPSAYSLVELDVSVLFHCGEKITTLNDKNLEHYRKNIPTARGLPLLVAIANQRSETIVLEYLDHVQVKVDVTPCL